MGRKEGLALLLPPSFVKERIEDGFLLSKIHSVLNQKKP
jgi:hypothetical protein